MLSAKVGCSLVLGLQVDAVLGFLHLYSVVLLLQNFELVLFEQK